MDDPYQLLGVPRDASAEDIRRAYRGLAKRWHPDTNPDKPDAVERFKVIGAAHALLSDPEQRARYDRGEIDAAGEQRATATTATTGAPGWRDFAEAAQGARYRSAPGGFGDAGAVPLEDDIEDFLARAFGAGTRRRGPTPGVDLRVALRIPFLDAARGATRDIELPDGRTVRLSIPAGVDDGTVLRLAGQGLPGESGAPAGDLLATIELEPHRYFRREGQDIVLDLPITLREAVLGAKVQVPTTASPVMLTIPPHAADGTRLRLRGRGVGGGNQIVVLRVVLPSGPEPELEAFLRDWTPRDGTDPRAGMGTP